MASDEGVYDGVEGSSSGELGQPVNWAVVGEHMGPYLRGALHLLESLGMAAPVGVLEDKIWEIYNEVFALTVACGRIAPGLGEEQLRAVKEILRGVRKP